MRQQPHSLSLCFVTREHDLGRLNYAAQIATVARIRMFPDRIHSLTIPCVPTDLLGIDFWGVGEGIGILESQAEIGIHTSAKKDLWVNI